MKRYANFVILLVATATICGASIFANVRGIVHDPQHRPIPGAQVTIRSTSSDWQATMPSGKDGSFQFPAVPIGSYEVTATAPGFAAGREKLMLTSGASPILHILLAIEQARTSIEVSAGPDLVQSQSSAVTTTVSRKQIAQTPGATLTNNLAMITDYVPSAYMVHDQLHIRGGHQVTWMLDGVPVPNTSIASNVGPQFDPKDIDIIEVQRGGYSAEYGDRTYGVFNVVTRSGFERNRGGEIIASYGTQNTTDNQISFGSHTEKFAYYGSLGGSRSDLGLETPAPQLLHDQTAGLSGFGSLIYNSTPNDQLRLITSVRGDHYQVPNMPAQQAAGVRDVENERDAFTNFTWLHTWAGGNVLAFSPFYHFNRAHYDGACVGNALDCAQVVPNDERSSNYAGGVVTLAITKGRHTAHIGFQGFAQHDHSQLALRTVETAVAQSATATGSVIAAFVEERFRATSWLTLNGGLRLTHFSGGLSENAADPRIGAAITIPHLNWVVRGFYGRYYQAPPLVSVGGPLLELAAQQGFGFLPLRGERDEQHEFGVTIPVSGWVGEITTFRTDAKNFFDHDELGNSNIFFPVTIDRARIRGWEATLRAPRIFDILDSHVAYSRQTVQGQGGASGGLTDFAPADANSWYFLDHDQRHTLSIVLRTNLPRHAWASGAVSYGSGFLNGDGPSHLPGHTTVDLSAGKNIGEFLTLEITALNVGNRRYLIDNSNTFGGTHWANPRQIIGEVKYRFHY